MEKRVAEWCSFQRRLFSQELSHIEQCRNLNISFHATVDEVERTPCDTFVITFSLKKKASPFYQSLKDRSLLKVFLLQDKESTPKWRADTSINGTLLSKTADTFKVSFKSLLRDRGLQVDTNVAVFSGENEVSYKRIFETLDLIEHALESNTNTRSLFMFRMMFQDPITSPDLQSLTISPPVIPKAIKSTLNESQRLAVKAAMDASEFFIIHGPPGTGKTSAICELVHQFLQMGKRILLCAPSNYAVDNAVMKILREQCLPKGGCLIRLGNYDRMNPKLHSFSLEQQVRDSEGYHLITEITKEIQNAERRSHFRKKRELEVELKLRLKKLKCSCVASANIVACTLNSAAHYLLDKETFDICIIDEASQSLVVESCIAISKSDKVILVGDPMQLPPVTVSNEKELEVSLMEILLKKFTLQKDSVALLDTQYRMNDMIASWSSVEFYNGQVRSHPSVEGHLLSDMEGIDETYETSQAIMFFDSSDYGYRESVDKKSNSKINHGEIGIVQDHIQKLIRAGVSTKDIGVITPYSAQARQVFHDLKDISVDYEHIEVNTVDAFQGREKLAIIISLVRSNEHQEVGFLKECRRLNVGFTRAQRQVLVIGDVKTSSSNDFLKRFWNYIEENGAFIDLDH